MTKKEKAELEHAKTVAALRWTGPVDRDVPITSDYRAPSEGWDYNAYNRETYRVSSTTVSHRRIDCSSGFGSQGGRALFSTRALALRAMRHDIETECAKKLRYVDQMIESDGNA